MNIYINVYLYMYIYTYILICIYICIYVSAGLTGSERRRKDLAGSFSAPFFRNMNFSTADPRGGGSNVEVRMLQCVAVCCSVLQCVAVCCSVLQCVAV